MKIRTGFVSNSSSASFIVHWRPRTFGNKVKKDKIIAVLTGVVYNFISDVNVEKEINEATWLKDCKNKFDEIMKNTNDNEDGTFTTTFFTCMKNSGDDFGEIAKFFAMSLLVQNDKFIIIDTRVEDEGG